MNENLCFSGFENGVMHSPNDQLASVTVQAARCVEIAKWGVLLIVSIVSQLIAATVSSGIKELQQLLDLLR